MIIRKATIHDAKAIAGCLLLAMEEIVYRLIGEKDLSKAKDFMEYFTATPGNQYSWENCHVAGVNDEVFGAINIYEGARLHELRQPVIDYIKARYDRDILPENETTPDEYYIDSFGVLPGRQGQGIGAQLLQFAINWYVIENGYTLGLLVDEENPNAKRLYLRLGFRSVGKKVLLGKNMEHLQLGRQLPAKLFQSFELWKSCV